MNKTGSIYLSDRNLQSSLHLQKYFSGASCWHHLFIVGVYSPPPAHILKSQKCWGGCFLSISKRIPAMLRCSAPSTKRFLRDILNRRLCNRDLIQNQLSYFDWKIDDIFALLLIDCAEDSQYKKQLIINHLSQNPNLDCSVFEAEHYLAAIYHAPDTTDIRRDLYSFADKFQIRGALSKSFHDLTNLHIYFEQAKNP